MVLDGTESLEVSHAGGEFQELTSGLLGDFWQSTSQRVGLKHTDYQTFRDHSAKRTATFSAQMSAMVLAYMAWLFSQKNAGQKGFFDSDEKCDNVHTTVFNVLVLDVFCTEKTSIIVEPTDLYLSSALVHHGLIPCSPITPKVAITAPALKLYHTTVAATQPPQPLFTARQRCPHLSIQAYVKSLCDMHGVPFYNHRSQQFSIALDVYLQILVFVSKLVQQALQCNQPDWHLKHGCPACTYTLQDEPPMRFKMLFTQDGNDSLKRVATKVLNGDLDDAGPLTASPTLEGTFHHEQYLTREFVDRFTSDRRVAHSILDEDGNGNLCAECWKNMKDSTTQKMWNVFGETGVFIAVCRHGFCLLVTDMVQSGEQSKYALAVTSKLLDAFGLDLGGGYDIGCHFKTTLASSVLGKHARSLNYTSLVNAFHGHAHNRLCQLDNLTTYVEGLRLEDLEGCEQAFSKSNALAPSIRYASIFHRRQAIAYYFEYNNEMEVYANLTKFLLNNYKQALDLLSNGHTTLERLMRELGVNDPTTFKLWLDKERVYLKSLLWEPAEETLQMEYWEWLVNLSGSRKDLDTILSTWTIITAHNAVSLGSDGSATRKAETMRHHAQENYKKDLKAVQELEGHLGISRRWVPEDEEWQAAARCHAPNMFGTYQQALDNLERLVMSRIFELSKMNQSGTGYKLCKHIGKALQTHSAAIQTALTQYNIAAKAFSHCTLEFDKVVEYAFLADFDLLRDMRQDISMRPWASPAAQLAINTYFKLCRAKEEVVRLNVEICRLVTYLVDEERYLRACKALYQDTHPALAHQISRCHAICSRFTPLHLCSLEKISHLPGFSRTLTPGISVLHGPGDSASVPQRVPMDSSQSSPPVCTDDVEEDADEDANEDHGADLEERCEALQQILSVTTDT
ncbi:hypothetical protein SCLCIDRAFT_126248 [Scleroderma citrinum Foug A]|uniref:CxC2-like cysteine cluster KDZ transposase-associated domain-containing protein n=1 Tax=Scleroderma citrinum Foug A TaxID=1036808 RepID=A0A0C3DFB1_9AGAM|nr:hypothetical protein SCLCIDRAFT_126248 [Scleroderma citrinum Foug A]